MNLEERIAQVENLLAKLKPRVELWKFFTGLVCGLILAGVTMYAHIRTSAQNAVQTEAFLRTLAAQVRPTCIFDSHGTLIDDFGAGDYIENIHVTPNLTNYGFEVSIKGRRHLEHSPIVAGLNVSLFPEVIRRTPGTENDWTILMSPQNTFPALLAEPSLDTNFVYEFRLEIIH